MRSIHRCLVAINCRVPGTPEATLMELFHLVRVCTVAIRRVVRPLSAPYELKRDVLRLIYRQQIFTDKQPPRTFRCLLSLVLTLLKWSSLSPSSTPFCVNWVRCVSRIDKSNQHLPGEEQGELMTSVNLLTIKAALPQRDTHMWERMMNKWRNAMKKGRSALWLYVW